MLQAQGRMGVYGEFHLINVSTKGIKGTGKEGAVDFWDLFQHEVNEHGVPIMRRNELGRPVPQDGVEVLQEKVFHNKFTKRALARMMHETLRGHGGTYAPAEVQSPTSNPFTYFVMWGDGSTGPNAPYYGDARPEWDESDLTNQPLLAPGNAVAGEGRRGIALSDTSGPLKRISLSYRSTSPYGEAEYLFYAQPNSPAYESGVNDAIDNFPIKSVGLAAAVAGDGEASCLIGVRSVIGLAPTYQGLSDRIYYHEGQQRAHDLVESRYPLDDNPAGLAVSSTGDGYVASSELAEAQIGIDSVGAGASDTINTDKTIHIEGAETMLPDVGLGAGFNAAHVRKVLRILTAATANNARDYTIREVVNSKEVKVFETPDTTEDGSATAITARVVTSYAGHNAFDARIENEGRVETSDTGTIPVPTDPPGEVIQGEEFQSQDVGGPHVVGRIWNIAVNNLTGIRIMVPAGTNLDQIPNNFKVDVLDPTANGGDPRPGYEADWINALNLSSYADEIYAAGMYGYEFLFSSPINAQGIRLSDMQAYGSGRGVRISQLCAFTFIQAGNEITLSGEKLELKTKSGELYRTFEPPDVSPTTSISDVINPLNQVLRGYEMEAVRSTLGFLWLRSTCAGDNSDLFMDAEGPESSNSNLGFPAGATQRTGITQSITKLPESALTLIYRFNITGNVPGGYE